MRALVALGNPGPEYAVTRHNAGFILADVLAERWVWTYRRRGRARIAEGTADGVEIILLKPQTYMNLSGAALRPLVGAEEFDHTRDLLVLVDDVALPLGRIRLRARGSAGGHNGLKSIEATLGSQEYARLRIGVGPVPEGTEDQADFVLSPFEEDELATFRDMLPTMVDAVECWLTEGIDVTMNRFNQRGPQSE